jgi:hypothetical protein
MATLGFSLPRPEAERIYAEAARAEISLSELLRRLVRKAYPPDGPSLE